MKLTEKESIEIVFTDKNRTATAAIPIVKVKEFLMDEAYEIITKPECNESTCAVNGFCECNPVNEDMEFESINLSLGEEVKTEHNSMVVSSFIEHCKEIGINIPDSAYESYFGA